MKLLNKSIHSYLVFACILMLIAIPVFYFAIQRIVKEDVDESLMANKEQVVSKLDNIVHQNSFSFLKAFEPNLFIEKGNSQAPYDSFYSVAIYDSISTENIPYRVLESNVILKDGAYLIRLKSSLLDSKDLIESIVVVMSILLLLIITGLILINRRISKNIWKPFYNTLDKLHHFRLDNSESMQFEKTNINEFEDLNSTISSLSQRNQQVYRSQKEFTENASHEMQTPLAIFQNKLELLMQTNPLTAEQAVLIEELANANQRMNRLNKSLLLLTRIENNQFLDKETISIKETTGKLIEQYKFQSDKKNIPVKNLISEDIYIDANKSLIETLLSNLLSNAIRHNIQGGYIRLTSGKNRLIIENSAKGQRLDSDKLFMRFQKQSTDTNSIGLGLEIVKKITDLYHFTIQYEFDDNNHRFLIQF